MVEHKVVVPKNSPDDPNVLKQSKPSELGAEITFPTEDATQPAYLADAAAAHEAASGSEESAEEEESTEEEPAPAKEEPPAPVPAPAPVPKPVPKVVE